jgi:ketosteroid isomerase-like protein
MYAGTYDGPNGVLENVFMRIGTEWEGFQAVPRKIVDGGDGNVAAFGKYSGKFLETGNSASVPFAHEWELNDGKITKFIQHTDTQVFVKELGL